MLRGANKGLSESSDRRLIYDKKSQGKAAVQSRSSSAASVEEREPTNAQGPPELYLEEIPKLLFVGLQQEDGLKAAVFMEELRDLVVGDSPQCNKNRESLKSLGGHGLIIAALQKHFDTQGFQMPALEVIGWLVNYQDKSTGQALARSGALEAVADTMMRYAKSEAVRECACLAIHSILWATTQNEKNGASYAHGRRFVLDLDGISMILDTMRHFPRSANVNFHAIQCLMRFLDYGSDAKEALRKGRAVSLVAATIDNHPNETALQKAAQLFMSDFFAA